MNVIGRIPALDDRFGLVLRGRLVVTLEPLQLEQRAARRHRALIVLGLEIGLTHFGAQTGNVIVGEPCLMQGVARRTAGEVSLGHLDLLIAMRNQWQAQLLPAPHRDQLPGQVLHVQPLGDDDDPACLLVVETAGDGAGVPAQRILPGNLGVRILGLDRIIDDDERSTPSGQRAAGGSREPISAAGRANFFGALFLRIEPGARKDPSVPG